MGDELAMEAKYIWNSTSDTKRSTSSGAFYLIARKFLEEHKDNSSVYGCAFNKEFVAQHYRVVNVDDLSVFQGSKYVQSNMNQVFNQVKDDLFNGKYVLFSGTACQVVAINKFCKNMQDRLFTIDVLCHGVPSPKLWREYVQVLQRREKNKIMSISFRNKSKTNRLGYVLQYTVNGKIKKIYPSESEYYSSFISSKSLRPSCYTCPFIKEYKEVDLTLGDSNNKTFHPTDAISLAIIRTDKGSEMLASISDECEMTDADYLEDAKTNKKLIEPAKKPEERENYYSNISSAVLDQTVSIPIFLKNRIKDKFPTSLKDFFRR